MLWKNTVSRKLLDHYYKITNDHMFDDYFLVGGTALALQLGHRESTDIDLFTLKTQDNEKYLKYLQDNFKNVEIINNSKNILQIVVDEIKIDLVSVKGKLIEPLKKKIILLCVV